MGAKACYRDLISENDLQRILALMEPYWEYHRAGDALHALRLWGADTVFPDKAPYPVSPGVRPWQPREMLGLYLDERIFKARFPGFKPYFFTSQHGLGERRDLDLAATVHDGNFLHLAAEIGLPLDTRMRWGERDFTLADVFAHSFVWFDLERELEFTAIAYGLYLQPQATWTNRLGDRYNLDSVAEALVKRDLSKCCCYGTHVPYALTVLLAADEQEPALSDHIRIRVRERLRAIANHLEQSQGAGGWWDRQWAPELRGKATSFEAEEVELVRSMGHHLEWIALAPADCRPNDECIRRCIRLILKMLGRYDSSIPHAYYFNPHSHAGRALVLLSGHRNASEVMVRKWNERSPNGKGKR